MGFADLDLGDARDADPTTRLFQMVKEADLEEDDDSDDLDEDIGDDVLLGPPSVQAVDDKVSRVSAFGQPLKTKSRCVGQHTFVHFYLIDFIHQMSGICMRNKAGEEPKCRRGQC